MVKMAPPAMRHVLITGATGFIGGSIAAKLLKRNEVTLILPIRAQSEAIARQRMVRSLQRFTSAPIPDQRIKILPVDLCTLANSSNDLLKHVTHVVHAAADTSFFSHRTVWEVNYHDTCRFAERMRKCPQLERFLYVGTAWICGKNPPALVKEELYPDQGVVYHVEYTHSKSAAEEYLLRMADFPLLVVRPSIVAGDTRLGCKPTSSIFWVFLSYDRMREITWPPDNVIDVVPADYVTRAILTLLFLPRPLYRRYHISAGVVSVCNWLELARAFALAAGEAVQADRYSPVSRFSDTALKGLCPTSVSRLRRSLDLYATFGTNTTFDNKRLLEAGCPAPPRFTDWIPRCYETVAGRTIDDLMREDD